MSETIASAAGFAEDLNPDAESLQDLLASESVETDDNAFARLPFRYAEIAKVLLDVCVPTLPSA